MRALLYYPFFGSKMRGGGDLVTANVIKVLEELGYEIIILSNYNIDKNAVLRICEELGVRLRSKSIIETLTYSLNSKSRKISFLSNILRSLLLKGDILINTGASFSSPMPIPVKLFIRKLPTLIYINGFRSRVTALDKCRNTTLRILYTMLLSKYLHNIKFVSCSNYLSRIVREELGISTYVIYPPVHIEFFKYDGSVKHNVAVTLGRMEKVKKFEIVIKAFKKAGTIDKLYIIYLPYDDQYLKRLKRIASNINAAVEFIEGFDRHVVRKYLLKAKLYLHACCETFGISIAEAMAAGCIPIVPSTGGQTEFVPSRLTYKNFDEFVKIIRRETHNPSYTPEEVSRMVSHLSDRIFRLKMKKLILSIKD